MKKLLCLVGPTASGKTALAVALAKTLRLEIVTCDSMQVYRGFDIGTAKPNQTEQEGIPHHMIDVAWPWEHYNAARYADDAETCIRDIRRRGQQPLVTGGTGLYLRALVQPLHHAEASPRDTKTRDWNSTSEQLHAELAQVDPETAAYLPIGDRRRVLRALMVFHETGIPLSEHHRRSRLIPPRYETIIIGLRFTDRQALYNRIDKRVDIMRETGLLREVQELLDNGLSPDCTAMQAIGYKELAEYLRGICTLSEAYETIRRNTRHLAKRQLTWFARQEKVCWFEADCPDLRERILEFVGEISLLWD